MALPYQPVNHPILDDRTGLVSQPWRAFFDSLLQSGATGINQLTGDVVAGPGVGSQVATIANNAVTFAKMQDIPASTLIGRGSAAGTGDPESITLGAGLAMAGTVLSASGALAAAGAALALLGAEAGEDGPMGPPGPPGTFIGNIEDLGYWSVLTDGDLTQPELVFAAGDVISVWVPL